MKDIEIKEETNTTLIITAPAAKIERLKAACNNERVIETVETFSGYASDVLLAIGKTSWDEVMNPPLTDGEDAPE